MPAVGEGERWHGSSSGWRAARDSGGGAEEEGTIPAGRRHAGARVVEGRWRSRRVAAHGLGEEGYRGERGNEGENCSLFPCTSFVTRWSESVFTLYLGFPSKKRFR